MAVATHVLSAVVSPAGLARLEYDYEDTSNPSDWDLVMLRCVNNMTAPVYVLIQRGNGVNFFEAEVAANTTTEVPPGGPVQQESDIPYMLLTTR